MSNRHFRSGQNWYSRVRSEPGQPISFQREMKRSVGEAAAVGVVFLVGICVGVWISVSHFQKGLLPTLVISLEGLAFRLAEVKEEK